MSSNSSLLSLIYLTCCWDQIITAISVRVEPHSSCLCFLCCCPSPSPIDAIQHFVTVAFVDGFPFLSMVDVHALISLFYAAMSRVQSFLNGNMWMGRIVVVCFVARPIFWNMIPILDRWNSPTPLDILNWRESNGNCTMHHWWTSYQVFHPAIADFMAYVLPLSLHIACPSIETVITVEQD